MSINTMPSLGLLRRVAVGGVIGLAASLARAQTGTPVAATAPAPPAGASAVTVDGRVALHSLASLSDAHLQKVADVLHVLAGTDAVRSGRWERIRAPLTEAKRVNVAGTFWFARPDGGYWTVETGRAKASLAERPYFARVLEGRTVIGDLVVSRSTNRNTAIVAVPVRGRDGAIVGALGGSVYLDSLAARLRREMGGLAEDVVFYAIDAQALGALNSDPTLIFTEPMKLGDSGMRAAFTRMLAGTDGVVTYTFRDSRRTVLYHKSPVTGWWYGFGTAQRPAAGGRE